MYNRPSWADNLATHGVRCYPKQTVRSVQDGNAESDRFCALRWSVLGSVADYPLESQIMSLKTESMHRSMQKTLRRKAAGFSLSSARKSICLISSLYRGVARVHEKGMSGNLEQPHPRSCRAYLHALVQTD